MDDYLIEKADEIVGRLQGRGYPLPLILRELNLLVLASALALLVGFYRNFPIGLFLILAGLSLILAVAIFSANRDYTADISGMGSLRVQHRYRLRARHRREHFLFMRILAVFFAAFALTDAVVNGYVLAVPFQVALAASWYAETASPRWPIETVDMQDAPPRRDAKAG